MYNQLKKIANQNQVFKEFIRHPIIFMVGWVYGAYLTLRNVDQYQCFPAIVFKNLIRLRINKAKGSKLIIHDKLIIEPWQGGMSPSSISIGKDAELIIYGAFIVGDDVRFDLSPSAKLILHGKDISSGSGITCKSVILVKKNVEIGKDTIIAWNTFITDCDWHHINGELRVSPTLIGDHVWIGVGCNVLKGAHIGQDCIVAPQSVVLAGQYPNKSLLAGIPAKVVKTSIDSWSRD